MTAYELPIGTEMVLGKRRWRLVHRDAQHPDTMVFFETTAEEPDPIHRTMYPSEVQALLDVVAVLPAGAVPLSFKLPDGRELGE